jgi:ABC-2 type transport system ATP-binding protein
MSADAIAADGLGKVFHPSGRLGDLLRGRLFGAAVQALSDVSFRVPRGEIVCVMGANGAGKSTLLRLLGGLLSPTSGRATVAGLDAATQATAEFRRRVAFVVGDERSFHWQVSGRENLLYFCALHGISRREAFRRSGDLLDRVGLHDAADRLFREYSRGMRQRLAIARGLLGDPWVVLLDEPTLGLDPRGARELHRFLREDIIQAAGRTAIVCSNDLTEARALADRVLFLEVGRLRGESGPDRIEAELGL